MTHTPLTPTQLQALADGRFDMYDGYLEIDGDTIEPSAHEALQTLATQLLTTQQRLAEVEKERDWWRTLVATATGRDQGPPHA